MKHRQASNGSLINYTYDLGGQLHSITNNSSYTYLNNVSYDRFGAKVFQEYGNGLKTQYSYDNITRRLSQISVTDNSSNPYSDIQYGYDPVGNVTQVTSTNPWLPSLSFSETFTYDASDQLVSLHFLCLSKENEAKEKTRQVKKSLSMTLIPSKRQNSFGCASLKQLPFLTPEYRDGLRLFFNADFDFAYYGYNASNTRTYKMGFLGGSQWVNGQPEPLSLQFQQAMFYPNAYINFNQNGEYTKHYYNGSERIASRLGNTRRTIVTGANSRLQARAAQMDELFKDQIIEMLPYEESASAIPDPNNGGGLSDPLYPTVEYYPIPTFTELQITGSTTDIYYYHTNHLGSTAFVTDQNQNVTQGFLYAPFGEITTEYAPLWQNATLPKYAFNAKELDEETGMYYYEARYYKPPVFTSRDPMFEKYFWMTPYAYCANNPVKYVDPDGRKIWIVGEDGSEVEYSYGMSTEGLDEFCVKVINALNDIYNTNTGKDLVDDLAGGTENSFYIIKSEENKFRAKNLLKAYKQQYLTDPEKTEIYDQCQNKSVFDGGSGGTVQWNPSGTMLPTTNGGKINAITDLAHELFHAKDANHGLLDDRLENDIKRCEWQAVYGENMLRKEMKVPLRQYYKIEVDLNNKYIGGTGTKMLKAGEPIKPWW